MLCNKVMFDLGFTCSYYFAISHHKLKLNSLLHDLSKIQRGYPHGPDQPLVKAAQTIAYLKLKWVQTETED